MDDAKLSKEVSYALRHAPWEYELELDDEGWVTVEQLLSALRQDHRWTSLQESDLARMIARSDKQRHELNGGKIRALYGHSVPERIVKVRSSPPQTLYHGTTQPLLETILREGLRPMQRQYVHLSVDTATALTVGRRKTPSPVLLRIDAMEAERDGVAFYMGNHSIWLADAIPPAFLSEQRHP
ncbi:RNA 2'-phosphotransferase [Paenibacillus sp. 598K]|uniref:RNA 2'-phosphotransferase n=1 Tax=Paenibacillus sp. 598K TaxID=1117987 RepID=UPI000FFA1537|nr:RNA 2'-phosphotransferase [Paenibacillus sp. 598K]GBF72219.1 RNA 2'-phosphotransferase [Paenibacillus sp. 598K]